MTLYAMPPGAAFDDDALAGVPPYRHGWERLENGVDLWRLADPARAQRLERALDEASAAGPDGHPWFAGPLVEQTVELLAGLEDALVEAGVMDAEWAVPADQVDTLAASVPAMDVRPDRTAYELSQALAEVLFGVRGVRAFLAQAMAEGWSVVLD